MKIDEDNGNKLFKTRYGTFVFKKANYDQHCRKRPRLLYDEYLEQVWQTLDDPDHITTGPKENKTTYYRVIKSQNRRQEIDVEVWQVPIFSKSEGQIIATAINFWSPNWQVIHLFEKTKWKKETSLI